MTDADLIHRLNQMQKSFDEADRAESGNYGNWYDGFYEDDFQCRVEAFEMFPGKKDPNALWLKMTCSVQHHPELAGREIPMMWNVMDEDKMPYLKGDFYALGVTDLKLEQLAPGSELLTSLLDVPVLVGVYPGRNGGWFSALRQRLDGGGPGDLGSAQQQIEDFDDNKPGRGGRAKSALAEVNEEIENNFKNKPEGCICPDPTQGDFDETCTIPGHGINF